MNARQSIIISIIVLIILRTGFTIIANTPPLVWSIVITIPAWFITAGAGVLFLLAVLWLRSHLWYIGPDLDRASRWLADDTQPLLTDLLDKPYTGTTHKLYAAVDTHKRESGVQ